MADRTYHAVILKRKDSGETDRRLTVLTQEAGIVDVVARGARKAASRLAGSSEPLSACILHVTEGKRNAFVTQVQPVTAFPGLRTDYNRLSLGLALTELAAAVLPHEQPSPDSFAVVVSSLKYFEVHEKPLVAFAWAETQLLRVAGFFPQFGSCVTCGRPIQEGNPFLSPHAGGYVCFDDAGRYTDRFQTKAEVLYGLDALSDLEAPPTNLKFVQESVAALYAFWRAIAGWALPANEEIAHLDR
jgi:DNA repair protein RecO (recombination protein O)